MGIRLPIYPYYVAQGKTGIRTNRLSYHNNQARLLLERFEKYLHLPQMQKSAFNVMPPLGSRTVPKRDWFKAPLFDEDFDDHSGLADLIDRVGTRGTIVIPNLTHIIGTRDRGAPTQATKKLMIKFDEEDIELLPLIIKTKLKCYDLERIIGSGKPDSEIFDLMPEIARFAVQHLRHRAISRNTPRDLKEQRQVLTARVRM